MTVDLSPLADCAFIAAGAWVITTLIKAGRGYYDRPKR